MDKKERKNCALLLPNKIIILLMGHVWHLFRVTKFCPGRVSKMSWSEGIIFQSGLGLLKTHRWYNKPRRQVAYHWRKSSGHVHEWRKLCHLWIYLSWRDRFCLLPPPLCSQRATEWQLLFCKLFLNKVRIIKYRSCNPQSNASYKMLPFHA